MLRLLSLLTVQAFIACAQGEANGRQQQQERDAQGDPLPSGAAARLGSTRLRAGWVHSMAFSPDGKTLASTSLGGGEIEFWDAATGRLVRRLKAPGTGLTSLLAFLPDQSSILTVSVGADSTIALWSLSSGERTGLWQWDGRIHMAALNPQGNKIAIGKRDQILLLEVGSWKNLLTLSGHEDGATAGAFLPDGKRLVSAGFDGFIRVWELEKGREVQRIATKASLMGSVAVSADSSLVAASGLGEPLQVWSLKDSEPLKGFAVQPKDKQSMSLQFSPAGDKILSAEISGGARVVDARSGRELFRAEGRDWNAYCACFTPDGRRFAATALADRLRVITFFDSSTYKEVFEIGAHTECVTALAFTPDGTRLLSVSGDRSIGIWDARLFKPLARIQDAHSDLLESISVFPDGSRAATSGRDGTIRIWDLEKNRTLTTLKTAWSHVTQVRVVSKGERLVAAANDKAVGVGVWDVASGQLLKTFKVERTSSRYPLEVSPDGEAVAIGLAKGEVALRSLDDGGVIRTIQANASEVEAIAFDARGALLATAGRDSLVTGRDSVIRVWDLKTGKEIQTMRGHWEVMSALVFSPDGAELASGLDGTVRVWEVASGKSLRVHEGHTGGIGALAYSPDGKWLASGSGDTTILIWPTQK